MWLNGSLLGRFSAQGPTRTMYVPGPLVRDADNHLDVLHPRGGHAARTLLGVAVVSSLPTAHLGLADFLRLDRAQKRVATVHVAANSGALTLGIASLWARRSDPTRQRVTT